MYRWLILAAALLLTGCSPIGQNHHVKANLDSLSADELARFLPVLADYPGLSWNVTTIAGSSNRPAGPYIDPKATVTPDGCADIPFQRKTQIAASADGFVPNGVAGNSGMATVRIMRQSQGRDLIDESLQWAKRCQEYQIVYSSTGPEDPGSADPTAVSALPAADIDGTKITRIQLVDNREHRFQPEGSRESVVSLAKVGDLVVVGYRHDNNADANAILSLTISRLKSGQPARKPLSNKADDSLLTGRTDKELQQLLPSTLDLATQMTASQSTPILGERAGEYQLPTTVPASCERTPFENTGWSSDTDRDFREIATVTTQRRLGDHADGEMVRLGIEKIGTSVITETTMWAKQCHSFSTGAGSSHTSPVTIDLLPAAQIDGVDITSVHVKGDSTNRIDYTASLFNIRGILVTTKPAVAQQPTDLQRQIADNLTHATYDTPSGPIYHGAYHRLPGEIKAPPPSAEATEKLARVALGNLVNPDGYRPGGYMPGDTKTTNPDYLHFRSPTGSIACTFRKYVLYCNVPQGTYPRTPKPDDLHGNWIDSTVEFSSEGIRSGIAAIDPIVYAESNTLDYGNSIRIGDGGECLMERNGLTCVDYSTRTGMHLSRDDLTAMSANETLRYDPRLLTGR
ncbi:hypothetical protein DE4585_02625 [Mycobacteroides salmoniphilum]|uniref:PknH-like extracellular domain-containing protein n=1 Tax=Mycobacteroides salmoniphilum TaxID=404941 RepID=A0A4R8S7J2_9MYCO|nr:hypothetical protein [Mycobacteroides salmoniphilum]TDZ82096.1 hypothetical protein DE4585_02625 [Mycobacteroides salmoniphilum]